MSAHALLNASGAHIWTICTRMPRYAQKIKDRAGYAAEEGSLAHYISEWTLRGLLGMNSAKYIKSKLKEAKAKLKSDGTPMYTAEMSRHVADFVTYVMEQYSEALRVDPKAKIFLEQRFDLSKYIPEGFGTADVMILYSGTLKCIDLKYGQKLVEAEGNPQLRIYALGGALEFDDLFNFDYFIMTIYQPRLERIDTSEISRSALLDFAKLFLAPRAKKAWNGEGDFVAGDHCTFCKAFAICPAAKERAMTLVRFKFATNEYIPDEAVSEVYVLSEYISSWAKEVKRYALEEAVTNGKKWPDLMLTNGRSVRKYKNEEKVVERLKKEGYSEEQIYKKSIIGIGEMENLLGNQFDKVLDGLVEKPVGAPTLVLESANREKYSKIKGKFKSIQ